MANDELGEGRDSTGDPDEGDPAEGGVYEDPEGLDVFDEMLVVLKSEGRSDAAIALQLGRSTKTVQRHRQRPAVKAALAARQRERVAEVRSRLGVAAVEAVSVLQEGLRSYRMTEQLRAAQITLNALFRMRSDDGNAEIIEEMIEQMAEIERLREGQEPA